MDKAVKTAKTTPEKRQRIHDIINGLDASGIDALHNFIVETTSSTGGPKNAVEFLAALALNDIEIDEHIRKSLCDPTFKVDVSRNGTKFISKVGLELGMTVSTSRHEVLWHVKNHGFEALLLEDFLRFVLRNMEKLTANRPAQDMVAAVTSPKADLEGFETMFSVSCDRDGKLSIGAYQGEVFDSYQAEKHYIVIDPN